MHNAHMQHTQMHALCTCSMHTSAHLAHAACTDLHTHVHIYIHHAMHTCAYSRIACTHVHLYTYISCTYISMHLHIHLHICTYTYTYNIRTCTRICIWVYIRTNRFKRATRICTAIMQTYTCRHSMFALAVSDRSWWSNWKSNISFTKKESGTCWG